MANQGVATLVVFAAFVVLVSNAETVNVTYIQNAVAHGIVCLDGSPGVYFYDQGFGQGADNWMIYLEGGGWCDTEQDCVTRSQKPISGGPPFGTNKNRTSFLFGQILDTNQTVNPDFYNWNRIYIPYCDGGLFMADVEGVKGNVYLRGARIFRAVIEELLAKGMKNANNAMLVGNSAGGLSTMLNCDSFRAFLPNAYSVKCVADSGFFISTPSQERRFARTIQFHELANVLPTPCTSRINSSLCLLPENFIGDILTPLFILNSAFDFIQMSSLDTPPGESAPSWQGCLSNFSLCTPNAFHYVKAFRTTFLKTLYDVPYNPTRGMFISSCYLHDFLWKGNKWAKSPTLENKTIANAIGDWVLNRSSHVCLVDETHDTPIDCGGDP